MVGVFSHSFVRTITSQERQPRSIFIQQIQSDRKILNEINTNSYESPEFISAIDRFQTHVILLKTAIFNQLTSWRIGYGFCARYHLIQLVLLVLLHRPSLPIWMCQFILSGITKTITIDGLFYFADGECASTGYVRILGPAWQGRLFIGRGNRSARRGILVSNRSSTMRPKHTKTADDVIVTDPDAAMRRMTEATRHILTVPKASDNGHPAKKHRKHKK